MVKHLSVVTGAAVRFVTGTTWVLVVSHSLGFAGATKVVVLLRSVVNEVTVGRIVVVAIDTDVDVVDDTDVVEVSVVVEVDNVAVVLTVVSLTTTLVAVAVTSLRVVSTNKSSHRQTTASTLG